MLESIAGPPGRRIDAGWCRVFHQSTENLMIGRLTEPTRQRIAAARAPRVGIVERLVERDVAEVEEEQDQHRGQARVPDPEGAPHRLAPEAAGDQRDRGERRADRRRSARRDLGQRMAPDQPDDARPRHHRVDHQRHPRRRHVDEHDPIGLALLVVRRRDQQGEVQADQRRAAAASPMAHGRTASAIR